MSESINDKRVYSLFEVTKSIQKTLAERYTSAYWIKAEMNKLNHYSHSGHCYPELVEKVEGKVIAQVKAILWKDDYKNINDNFLRTLQEPLNDGIKILFMAKISFEPNYGLSLKIIDIDPNYTLGDLEREKHATIEKLQLEGIFNNNKKLPIALLPQRIAVISVETSKGYGDFLNTLNGNPWGYHFFHVLFPSLLQGEKAVAGIIKQLQLIKKVIGHFDVVAIIRGGGGDAGLSCYNNYSLAKEIANFPIPVLTGIGHVTNETVCEMVSFNNEITPSKLAEFLIQKFHNYSVPVHEAQRKISDRSRRLLMEENTRFRSEIKLFRSVTENILGLNRHEIKNLSRSLQFQSQFVCKNESESLNNLKNNVKMYSTLCINHCRQQINASGGTISKDVGTQLHHYKFVVAQLQEKLPKASLGQCRQAALSLDNLAKNISNMSPMNVLKRGYSITLLHGKSVKNIEQVNAGDELTTKIAGGEISSIVQSTNAGI